MRSLAIFCALQLGRILSDKPYGTTVLVKSELEKMLAGEPYESLDPELVRRRSVARDLCWDFNATREAQQDERRALLSKLLGSGGDTAWIQPPFFCDYGSNIRLGARVYFNFNCVVLDVCEVTIGDFTLFGPAVQIYTATHPLDATERRLKEFGKPVRIGCDCWIGGGAIILPGVSIGARSVIGAGSVVTRDVPNDVVAAGNPCQVVRVLPAPTTGS
jgi:maltose O-acetyltransferase